MAIQAIQTQAHHTEWGLFVFLLIYVIVVSTVAYAFSPGANANTVSFDGLNGDTGFYGGGDDGLGVGFIGILWGIITSMFGIMTFSIPLVPPAVQLILAIPMYAFIIVLFPLLVDVINVSINLFNAVTKWL